uniref:DDM n=1 Tax=Populus tomentosa TaxID=118781 RepID=U3PV42_POPTO|nr:DDM [Populus tomentosa]
MSKSETDAPPMVGGDGTCSYCKNSYLQRRSANVVKEKIEEEIAKKLDFHNLAIDSSTFRLADLGCSVGPKTFFHVQDLLEAIKQKYEMQFHTSQIPEFQLSKLPEQLLDTNSPAWNRGRIHYTNAPNEVVNAYASQFAKDMENFLNARSKELVSGGMIGVVSEAQVDSFNLPFYAASPEEMTEIVERNGFFNIERMELNDPAAWLKRRINIPEWAVHVKAAMEESSRQHFGGEVLDELFDRLTKNLIKFSDELELKYREKTLLLVVLKRQ